MDLTQELETLRRELPSLLREHRAEYVLVHGDRVDSFWKTEEEAYKAGCERFGLKPFLVMPVVEREEPLVLSSNLIPRCRF
jgi:hypothetical protein